MFLPRKTILIYLFTFLFLLTPAFAFSATFGSSFSNRSYSTTGLNRGLVGYWTMDAADMAGTQVYDRSGQLSTGTIIGGATKTIGKLGQGLKFDGSTGYVNGGSSITLPTTSFTYSVWYKPTVVSASIKGVLSISPYDSSAGAAINVDQNAAGAGSAGKIVGWFFGADNSWHGTGIAITTLVVNKWYLLTMTYDKQNFSIYVNGIKENSNPFTTNVSFGTNPEAKIGLSKGTTNEYANGIEDDARIYNRALSASEIKQLYAQGSSALVGSNLQSGKSYATTGLKSGLVGYWTFDATDTAGMQTYDKSGNVNTGTFTTGVTKTIGKFGQAKRFDGSTGMITIADSSSLSFGNSGTDTPFTLSVWSKFTTTGVGYFLTKEPNTNSNREWLFGCYTGVGIYFALYTDVGGARIAVKGPCTAFTVGTWHHAVATYDGSKSNSGMNIYIDGVRVNNGTDNFTSYTGMNNTTSPVIIGAGDRQTLLQNQVIDDVRIWNRALSLAEIKQLYATGSSAVVGSNLTSGKSYATGGLNSGLFGYWTFDGADGATDKSGQGNNGTINGGVTKTIGKLGQAFKFDGSTGYISAANTLSTYAGLTYAAWIKTTESSAGWRAILQRGNILYMSRFTVGKIVGVFDGSSINNSSADESITSVNDGKWHYVVGTNDGTKTKIYIDGKLEKTYNETLYVAPDPAELINIGANAGTQNYWNGSIDDVRIYTRALSAAEIQQLYIISK